jgi:hypothetical protein
VWIESATPRQSSIRTGSYGRRVSNDTLFVVLGAGSSHAASSLYPGARLIRPPLVSELFDARWHFILDQYPMAKHAAPDIIDAMSGAGADAVSLEAFLRTRYRHSEDPYDKRRWYSIVAYLQHLLWWVSVPDQPWVPRKLVPRHENQRYEPDYLSRVVNMVLGNWDHVCFVTLNYDLILDRYLNQLDPLTQISDFIAYPRWSLIKLHGSVTWNYKLSDSVSLSNPPADLDDYIVRDEIFHSWRLEDDARQLVYLEGGSSYPGFPALSAPLGEEDELVCPPEHVAFVKNKLSEVNALDLLVIGYSAYDKAVLNLLAESQSDIRSLYVVSESADVAQAVAERIGRHVGVRRPRREFWAELSRRLHGLGEDGNVPRLSRVGPIAGIGRHAGRCQVATVTRSGVRLLLARPPPRREGKARASSRQARRAGRARRGRHEPMPPACRSTPHAAARSRGSASASDTRRTMRHRSQRLRLSGSRA